MVGKDLNLCFEKLMMVGGIGIGFGGGKVKMEGRVITDWKDIPMELLLQILALVDDQMVIVASRVCRGWRDDVCLGLTRLSPSWCQLTQKEFNTPIVLHVRLQRGGKRRDPVLDLFLQWERRKDNTYSQDQIDEVRAEWAGFLVRYM